MQNVRHSTSLKPPLWTSGGPQPYFRANVAINCSVKENLWKAMPSAVLNFGFEIIPLECPPDPCAQPTYAISDGIRRHEGMPVCEACQCVAVLCDTRAYPEGVRQVQFLFVSISSQRALVLSEVILTHSTAIGDIRVSYQNLIRFRLTP